MERFVDIHTHILPGMDDGAQNPDQALELLKMAWDSGIGAVILTPHYRGHYRRNTPQQLRQAYESLCAQAKKELPELELYLGNEVGIEIELAEKLTDGRTLSLNGGSYVLLEFHSDCTAKQVVNGVLDILNCGFTPIIAHAERCDAFLNDRHLAGDVIDFGALIQLNAAGVMGRTGCRAKRCCHRLLKKNQVHFIASDAHDMKTRPPRLDECYRLVCKKYGEDYADALFRRNARTVLTSK
ncbi:MAG: capsular biosynthesis protein [Oscillospiraceae bacterium]|nr:capsular biosynthesis protein [Oscillospiraceae bacterium]